MRLCDAETMREMDRYAIEEIGIPGVVLMENAGRGTARLIAEHFEDVLDRGVTVLCGRGNNGGDGFVVARHLHNWGYPVRVYLLTQRDRVGGDAAINLQVADRMGIPILEVPDEAAWEKVRDEAVECGLVVDAMLGTGLHSDVRGLYRRVIEAVNAGDPPVAAVDIPSGLDSSSGRPHGVAVHAEMTATYGLAKIGLVQDTAVDHVGELHVVDISIPRERIAPGPAHDRLVEAADVAECLPSRPFSGHKGTFGHLCVLAGSVGKVGAAVLASHAALRSGVGLVTLAIPKSAVPYLSALGAEVMLDILDDEGTGHLTPASIPQLDRILENRTAIAMGPGLSTEPGVREVLVHLLEHADLPMVIDADGLNALAGGLETVKRSRAPVVLTPHPGEAGRLLGISAREVQADRVGWVRKLAADAGAVVVLKGARTLTATPAGRVSVNPTGNSGMASAGSGDVLTGLIGGLLAQRSPVEDAAVAGVFLHGLAGDIAAELTGTRALVAGDIVEAIGAAFQSLLEAGGDR